MKKIVTSAFAIVLLSMSGSVFATEIKNTDTCLELLRSIGNKIKEVKPDAALIDKAKPIAKQMAELCNQKNFEAASTKYDEILKTVGAK